MESSPQRPQRKRRKDAGQPRWEDRDYYVLQWIGQQGIIRFDQLRRLLGRESEDLDEWEAVLSESATRNAIDRWEAGRLINSAHIVPKEPGYYWLSNAGFQFVELDLCDSQHKMADTFVGENNDETCMEASVSAFLPATTKSLITAHACGSPSEAIP